MTLEDLFIAGWHKGTLKDTGVGMGFSSGFEVASAFQFPSRLLFRVSREARFPQVQQVTVTFTDALESFLESIQ